jgi:hypothetical protein
VRGKQDHAVAQLLELATPEVGRTTSLHHDCGRRLLREEVQDLGPGQPDAAANMARAVGEGHLEDGLCNVHGDDGMVLRDGLLLLR